MEEEKNPIIFISYSHDSPDHKEWVAKLAMMLFDKSVNVIFDQWDLGLGDDLPKFMEKSVNTAERVLCICTETYVNKANDGIGGVGYEAMIVSGQLVRNLGTSKFIPIIRQEKKNSQVLLPSYLSTRNYIDFSDDNSFNDNFNILLHNLLNEPIIKKPPIGKNPFVNNLYKTPIITLTDEQITEHLHSFTSFKDVHQLYEKCLSIIMSNDTLAWRKLIQSTKIDFSKELNIWLSKFGKVPPEDTKQLIDISFKAASIFEPLICVALSGVESAKDSFKHQNSIIDDILYLKNWTQNGYIVYININRSIVFLYQALYGALSLQTNQINLAYNLINTHVKTPNEETLPLCKVHDLIGWPESFGHDAKVSWNVLLSMPNQWPWLVRLFGNSDEYVTSLIAYYLFLNFFEYLSVFINSSNPEKILSLKDIMLDIPFFNMRSESIILNKSYNQLLRSKSFLLELIHKFNLDRDSLKENWQSWINICNKWLLQVYHHPEIYKSIYSDFIKDLFK